MSRRPLILTVSLMLMSAVCTLNGATPDEIYLGWLAMYVLNFQDAHQRISRWEQANPQRCHGPTSQATDSLRIPKRGVSSWTKMLFGFLDLGDLLLGIALLFASMIAVFVFMQWRHESRREQNLLDPIEREYQQFFQPV
ncbi:MAG TPA: hypothetical protein VHZ55_11565 [Bryobacteraceae bacterium]|nr:hypothetical protein [Bryobacteraceae bacterium]